MNRAVYCGVHHHVAGTGVKSEGGAPEMKQTCALVFPVHSNAPHGDSPTLQTSLRAIT